MDAVPLPLGAKKLGRRKKKLGKLLSQLSGEAKAKERLAVPASAEEAAWGLEGQESKITQGPQSGQE